MTGAWLGSTIPGQLGSVIQWTTKIQNVACMTPRQFTWSNTFTHSRWLIPLAEHKSLIMEVGCLFSFTFTFSMLLWNWHQLLMGVCHKKKRYSGNICLVCRYPLFYIGILVIVQFCCLFTSLFSFLLSLFVTLYIFLYLHQIFWRGWVGAVCIFWYECFLVVFNLQELACMHCVYLVLWTHKVLCGSFFMRHIYINFHSDSFS